MDKQKESKGYSTYRQIPNVFREYFATFQILRAAGYPAENIYCSPSGGFVHLVVVQGLHTFLINCGYDGSSDNEIADKYQKLVLGLGNYNQSHVEKGFRRSAAVKDAPHLLANLLLKGFFPTETN